MAMDITKIDALVLRLARQLNAIYIDLRKPDRAPYPHEPSRHLRRYLFPTGAYAASAWHSGDNIRLVCMSDDRPERFWEIVGEVILVQEHFYPATLDERLDLTDTLGLTSILGTASLTLHHCRCPEAFNPVSMLSLGVPSYLQSQPQIVRKEIELAFSGQETMQGRTLSSEPVRDDTTEGQHLGMIRDAITFASRYPADGGSGPLVWENVPFFRHFAQTLCDWAHVNGFIGPHLGLFDSEMFLWILHDYTKRPATSTWTSEEAATRLVQNAVLRSKTMYHPDDLMIKTASGRDLLQGVSYGCLWQVSQALQRAAEKVSFSNITLPIFTQHLPTDGWHTFATSAEHFAIIDFECWAPAKPSHFQKITIPSQLQDFTRFLSQCIVLSNTNHPWPEPLLVSDDGTTCTYVAAIFGYWWGDAEFATSVAEWQASLDSDRTHSLVEVRHCLAEDLASEVTRIRGTASPPPRIGTSIAKGTTTRTPRESSLSPPKPSKSPRGFRPAGQILNRLKWDPGLAVHSYEVGYEDRFDGLQYMPLEQWGNKAVEEEDFIPEHRIRVFRRVEDDGERMVVWDRDSRVDIIS